MTKLYIHQTRDYGLGNFINLTPTIRMMYDHLGYKIPVFFEHEFIRDCFIDCEFIEILKDKPKDQPFFTSGLVNFRNNCPDYIHAYKEVVKSLPLEGDLPHTYVDRAKEIAKHDMSYTLFIRGGGNEATAYLFDKLPANEYYQTYEKGKRVFTGSQNDYERLGSLFHWKKGEKVGTDMEMHIGDIRKSLALIRDAKLVVANDSGLAHAAAAMNKKMVILWKNTHLPKNSNPGKGTIIKLCH